MIHSMSQRTIALACAIVWFLSGVASFAQNIPDSMAGPLCRPIEQLQASPKWRVFAAVVTHDHTALQSLLDGGDSPNQFSALSACYRLPVTMACQLGDLEAVKILVKGGADINLFDSRDENALITATMNNQIEIVRYLLAHGAQVNAIRASSGETALFTALRNHQSDLLTLLIQGGANVNLPNKSGETPLIVASLADDLEMVKYLKTRGAKFNSPKEEFLCAASHGDVKTLQRILADGESAKPHNWLYRLLFKHRIEAQKRKWTASLINQSYGHGLTPLMAAAENGRTGAVKAIIAAGADINALDSEHDTPLMYAIKSGSKSTIFALRDAGADPTIADLGGVSTLLQAATYLDDPDVVHFLIQRGVPVNAGSIINETPLMAAACFGRIETVKILLDAHVPVNAQSTEGLTALSEAASSGEADILTLLLKAGADPSIKDGESKSALDYAIQLGHPAAVAILQKSHPAGIEKTATAPAN